MATIEPTYHVALSFAYEDRDSVEKVASKLRSDGVEIFYDTYGEAVISNFVDLNEDKTLEPLDKGSPRVFVDQIAFMTTWTGSTERSSAHRSGDVSWHRTELHFRFMSFQSGLMPKDTSSPGTSASNAKDDLLDRTSSNATAGA